MRRGLPLAAVALVVGGFLLATQRDRLWRRAYPHLPARVQAMPYRLPGLLPLPRATPVSLPTLAGASRVVTPLPPPTIGVAMTSVPTPAEAATATAPRPAAARIAGVRHAYQRWNNCGPATVAMALSVLGDPVDQMAAAQMLKPDPDDKNVGPEELARYARGRGVDAIARVSGDHDRLRALVAAGFPVIVETWFVPKPGDEMGHYRLITGYSDAEARYQTADSYEGPDVSVTYDELDRLWRAFNRAYVVVFPTADRARVEAILAADRGEAAMFRHAYEQAVRELGQAEDAFGWFNLGSSLVGLGDMAGAAAAFDRARAIGLPWRMLWYQFGPFEAYAALGRWADVRSLAEANLRNAGNLEESLYWRGRARAADGDALGAAADYRRALALQPTFAPARAALDGLP